MPTNLVLAAGHAVHGGLSASLPAVIVALVVAAVIVVVFKGIARLLSPRKPKAAKTTSYAFTGRRR